MCVNLVSMDVKLLTNIHTIYDDYIGSRRNLGQRFIYSSNYKKIQFRFFCTHGADFSDFVKHLTSFLHMPYKSITIAFVHVY